MSIGSHRSQSMLTLATENLRCEGQILKEGSSGLSKETNMFYIKFPGFKEKNVKSGEKYSSSSSWVNAVILSLRAQKLQFSI